MKSIHTITYLLLFLLSYLLDSCSTNGDKSVKSADIYVDVYNDAMTTDKMIDTVSFLPLENVDSAALKRIDKMIVRDNKIFLGDLKTHKIATYDTDGKLLYVISKVGSGPDEYKSIQSFTTDNENVYIIDTWTQRMISYDVNTGEYRGDRKLPVVAHDVERIKDGFILAYHPQSGSEASPSDPEGRLTFVDFNLNITKSVYPIDYEMSDPILQTNLFTANDDNIVYGSFLFDGFTVIDRNMPDRMKTVRLNFKNGFEDQGERDSRALNKCEYLTETPYLVGDYVYFWTATDRQAHPILYNLKNGTGARPSRKSAEKYLLPVIGSYSEGLISLLDDADYYDQLIEHGFEGGDDAVKETLEDEGIVLIFYKLK